MTVGATVLALLPLSLHGGQLWKPLGYAQLAGLLVATVLTQLQVPWMYAIFVLDLKIFKWETAENELPDAPPSGQALERPSYS
jgi:Cu/Ag efflux pump CusA